MVRIAREDPHVALVGSAVHTGRMTLVADEKAQLRQVEEQVLSKLGDAVSPAAVRKELRNGLRAFADAPIRTYVPVLLQKQLLDTLRPRG